jgi:type III HopA1-like effector protein
MSRYREQVAAALGAVRILGPTQYAWLGRRSRRLPASLAAAMDAAEQRRYLVACLREELYYSFYCRGTPVSARWGEPQPVAGDPSLLAAFAAANHVPEGWDGGWTVQRVEGDDAVVSTPRLRVWVAAADCTGDLRPGGVVSVRRPSAHPYASPGFWTVVGDAVRPASDTADVRVYWNVARTGAPALVGALTSWLSEQAVPFRLKVANHAARLDRCDAAVLYLHGADFTRARARLKVLAIDFAPQLLPEVPAFTLRMAAGVGLAEDADGESFGVRRCALLADAVVRAHESGLCELDAQVEAVADRFAEAGVAIDRPYLDPDLAGRNVL